MTLNIEKIWKELLERGRCSRCDGPLETIRYCDSDSVRCVICGERYYKNYPKRSRCFDLCLKCGGYFRVKEKGDVFCEDCKKALSVTKKNKNNKKSIRQELII